MLRVIKVGGSLLVGTDLRERLLGWLAQESPATNIFVVGGGELADGIRRLDERFELGGKHSHVLCSEILNITGRLLHMLLPETILIDSPDQIAQGSSYVFLPYAWLMNDHVLPWSWATTTDSVAAHLAKTINAAELVLLKSAAAEPTESIQQLAERGYVDEYFPTAANGLQSVRFENLLDQR